MKNSLFKEQKYTEAFNIFRQAAEFGDPRAQCYLGTLYLSKMGIPDQEFVMADVFAEYWYTKAMNQNFARGAYLLAYMHKQGRGIPRSIEQQNFIYLEKKAFSLWKEFPLSDSCSQFNFAEMYQFRFGLSANECEQADKMAIYWYRKAADQGHADAQIKLGGAYALGAGVARDEGEAVQWYRKAADQGHQVASVLAKSIED